MGFSSDTDVTTGLATSVANTVLHLAEIGDFQAAALELGQYWPPSGEDSHVLLLIAQGAVASGLGNLPLAADLFSRAHRLAGDDPLAGKAAIGSAVVAWKRGEIKEARVWMDMVPSDSPFSFCGLTQKATIEKHDPKRALEILAQAEALAEENSDALRGRFHNLRGIILRSLADSIKKKSKRQEAENYRVRAALEYEAALYFFDQCNSHNQRKIVFINLIGLYLSGSKYQEAHRVADRVIRQFQRDPPHLGMSLDQKANILIAERRYPQAIEVAQKAVSALSKTDRSNWLAEALITLGIALARAGKHDEARSQLNRAAELCEHTGDPAQADTARIAIIQELPITCAEAFQLFLKSQGSFLPASKALIHRIEAEGIRDSLERHHGSLQEAAQEFDITRQGLAKRIETLFPHLCTKPKRVRRWKTKPR